jgi:CRP-like cAMP-binding protein
VYLLDESGMTIRPMSLNQGPFINHMLTRVPAAGWERWQRALNAIELQAGEVLFEDQSTLTHLYFPTSAIVSITHLLRGGESIEVAMIGSEGIAGASSLLGGGLSNHRGIVLRSGQAYRLSSAWLRSEFETTPDFLQMMLRYSQSLITQISQVLACSCHHTVEQQLSRWLLMYADRADNTSITVTQEHLASALGVGRERQAKAPSELKKKGLIQYSRGCIEICNTRALRDGTCECYGVIQSTYEPMVRPQVIS